MSNLDLAGLVETPSQDTSQNMNQQYFRFAGFYLRLIATVIDGVVVLLATLILTFALQALIRASFSIEKDSPFELLAGLITIFYNISMVYVHGATIGKKLFHIRVVNKEYNRVTLSQAIMRETIGKIISGLVLNLGYFWVLIDDKKQGWHDKIAKTYVIHNQPITKDEFETQQKQSNLPLVLILTGVLELILPVSIAIFIIPQLTKLYGNLNTTGFNSTFSYGFVGLMIALALMQILFGIIFMKEQKRNGSLAEKHEEIAKILVIAGIVLTAVLIPVMITSILGPLYSALHSIQ